MISPRRSPIAWRVCLAIALAGAAIAVAESAPAFGGFIVSGNSMEPGIRSRDLVLVRSQPDYAIGDVVMYHHPDIGPVLHRIVGKEPAGFVLQGDNRDAPDAYPVPVSSIRGRLALRIAGIGALLQDLGARAELTAFLFAIPGAVIAWASWRKTRRAWSRGGISRSRLGSVARGEFFAMTLRGMRLAAGLAAIACLAIVAIVAITVVGLDEVGSRRHAYEQQGSIGYSATGAPGVYDAQRAQTGDPIFRHLAHAVDVSFVYKVVSQAPSDLNGTYQLSARLAQANGWTRSIPLVPETSFRGSSVQAQAVLDLDVLQDLIDSVERQTGVSSRNYLLALVATVTVQGKIAGQPVRERFRQEQRFVLDMLVVQPVPLPGASEATFERSQTGSVAEPLPQQRHVRLPFVEIPLHHVLIVAIALLSLSLPALVGWLVALIAARRSHAEWMIEARYQEILVDGWIERLSDSQPLIAVNSITDLVRIAELEHVPVLHAHDHGAAGARYYVVGADGSAYYYTEGTRAPRSLWTDRVA